jgi:hypothetical protein
LDCEVVVVDEDVVVELVVDELVVDEVVVVDELVVVGLVVDVVDADVVDDDVVDVEATVVAGGDSSSDERRAKMIRTAATATMRTARAQKIGLLIALLSVGGGPPATRAASPAGGTVWVGSVGFGSIAGIAWVGSSAPGYAPVGSSPPTPGAPSAPLASSGCHAPVPSFGVSLMTFTSSHRGSGDAERSGLIDATWECRNTKKARKNLRKLHIGEANGARLTISCS